MLRVEHDACQVLKVQPAVCCDDLADEQHALASRCRSARLLDMARPSCLGVAATDEEDVVAELARRRSRVVHLHLEMAEDQRGLGGLA